MKVNKVNGVVAYYRVSTQRQGQSGLGLEAQRAAVEVYAKGNRVEILGEYQDVESGKRDDRPQLAAALEHAKAAGVTLIIAKLDRLSRDGEFLYHLRKTGVPFVALDIPDANTLTLGVMIAMAQHEREIISARTKAGLAVAKARGKKLGGDRGGFTDEGRRKSAVSKKAAARRFATGAMTHAANYRRAGWPLRRIADELNKAGSTTRYGHPFTPTAVQRLLAMEKGSLAYNS
jgi:DNA invertase Pin-like site-specific DNA recombinase